MMSEKKRKGMDIFGAWLVVLLNLKGFGLIDWSWWFVVCLPLGSSLVFGLIVLGAIEAYRIAKREGAC